jgi:hypothetical protein
MEDFGWAEKDEPPPDEDWPAPEAPAEEPVAPERLD